MSKKIKQLEMDALRKTFQGVRDMVILTASGVDCQQDDQFRAALRKKKVRVQMVKNSLAKQVFDKELNIKISGIWEGPTLIAWGTDSVAELSRSIDELLKKNEKIKVKKAVAEGQEVSFEQALKMPTKAQAIGEILALLLSPGRRLAGQLTGAGGRLAAQVKAISEKKPEEPAAPPAEPAPAGEPGK